MRFSFGLRSPEIFWLLLSCLGVVSASEVSMLTYAHLHTRVVIHFANLQRSAALVSEATRPYDPPKPPDPSCTKAHPPPPKKKKKKKNKNKRKRTRTPGLCTGASAARVTWAPQGILGLSPQNLSPRPSPSLPKPEPHIEGRNHGPIVGSLALV